MLRRTKVLKGSLWANIVRAEQQVPHVLSAQW
jgi:hypothetical protein